MDTVQYKSRTEVEGMRLAAKGLTDEKLVAEFQNQCLNLAKDGILNWPGFPFIRVTVGVNAHLEFSQLPGEKHLMFPAEWYQVLKEEILRRMSAAEN